MTISQTAICAPFSALALAALLSACSQGPGTIYKETTLADGKSITTGARQRLISNTPAKFSSSPGRIHPERVLCVEPSPDVAVAVANSFGVSLSVLGQGSGSVSGAQAEGLAQIAERTVAIQALLKQGYQACLDYANGAISGTTYSLRASRLDDLLVTLVLAENASGAYGRSGAALGSKARAEAEAKLFQLGKASGDVGKLQEDLKAAETKVQKEKKDVDDKQKEVDRETDATKKKALETDLASEKEELRQAEVERDAILQQLQSSSEALTEAAAEVTSVRGIGGLTPQTDPEVAKVLGQMQARFLAKEVDQAYISTCLTELGHRKIPTKQDSEFRQVVLEDVKHGDNERRRKMGSAIGRKQMESFFFGSFLGDENRLTRHCEENLPILARLSIENRQAIKLRELEIEHARILAKAKEEPTTGSGDDVIVLSALNRLARAAADLKTQHDTLFNLTIKPAGGRLSAEERQALADERSERLSEANTLFQKANTASSGAQAAGIKMLQSDYTDQRAAEPEDLASPEGRIWRASFELVRVKAEVRQKELEDLARQARVMTERLGGLMKRIEVANVAADEQ